MEYRKSDSQFNKRYFAMQDNHKGTLDLDIDTRPSRFRGSCRPPRYGSGATCPMQLDRRRARRNILRHAGPFAPRRFAIRLRCGPARSRIHAFGRRRRVRRASLNRLSGSRAWPPSPPLLRPCSNLHTQCTSKPKCIAQTHRSAFRYGIRAPRAGIVTTTNETSNYNPNALTHSRSVLTCNSTTLANGSW